MHLIHIHFCFWLGLFADRWWLSEVLCAPNFLSNCCTCVTLAAPKIRPLSGSKLLAFTTCKLAWISLLHAVRFPGWHQRARSSTWVLRLSWEAKRSFQNATRRPTVEVITCMITRDFKMILITSQASLSLSHYNYYYSQKSLTHNIPGAFAPGIIRVCTAPHSSMCWFED